MIPYTKLADLFKNSLKEESAAQSMQKWFNQLPEHEPWTPMTDATEGSASPTILDGQTFVGDVNEDLISGRIGSLGDHDDPDDRGLDDSFGRASFSRLSRTTRADLEEDEVPGDSLFIQECNSDQTSSTSGTAGSIQLATKRDPRSSRFLETDSTAVTYLKVDLDDGESMVSKTACPSTTVPLFTSALADTLSKALPKDIRLPHYQVFEKQAVLNNVEDLLKMYCIQIMKDDDESFPIKKTAEAICCIRTKISLNVLNVLSENNELERTIKQNIFMPSLINDSQESSKVSRPNEKEFSAVSADDQIICDYLVRHGAFSSLQKDLHGIVEAYLCDQTQLISLRISRTFRLPSIFITNMGGKFNATFATDWDLAQFLEDQYPKGRLQPLRDVLAITGNSENAQMCTVEQYLRQNWTRYTFELTDHLAYVISGGANSTRSSRIIYSTIERLIYVHGPEDFIVTIGQQLAWLGAACRVASGQLASCYTTFTVETRENLSPTFRLSHKTSPNGIEDSNSCWHELVGDSVIAYGFPIPERIDEVRGLHLSVELMALLGRIPFATYFDGGYVLKGRSFIIVPLQRRGASVQWHLFQNKNGGRIEYEDISELAPDRLLVKERNGPAFLSTFSYLGWCPQCNVNLATESYNYRGIKYTKSESKPRLTITADSFMIGFQQWGAAGVNFTLGRHQGFYRNRIAQFYRDLLSDSSNVHVVLQDMEARRAWHTDAETMILHIILHRYELGSFDVTNTPVHLERAKFDNPNSVREAMLSNRDISIEVDKHLNEAGVNDKQFSHIVNELFQVFDGLQANQRQIARKRGFDLNGLRGREVCGWEYLDIVNRAHHPEYRRTQLKETCGQWPELMRQLNAVVLYGSFFQDAFEPSNPAQTCLEFKHLPQGKDYLAMQVPVLNRLYHESGTLSNDDEKARITSKGARLCPSKYLFDLCPCNAVGNLSASKDNCLGDRIQYLDFKSSKKITKLAGLGETGAIIVGKRVSTSNIWGNLNKPTAKPKDTSYSHGQGIPNSSSRTRTLGMTAVSLPLVAVTPSPPQPVSPLSRSVTMSQVPIQQTPLLYQQSPTSQQVP